MASLPLINYSITKEMYLKILELQKRVQFGFNNGTKQDIWFGKNEVFYKYYIINSDKKKNSIKTNSK